MNASLISRSFETNILRNVWSFHGDSKISRALVNNISHPNSTHHCLSFTKKNERKDDVLIEITCKPKGDSTSQILLECTLDEDDIFKSKISMWTTTGKDVFQIQAAKSVSHRRTSSNHSTLYTWKSTWVHWINLCSLQKFQDRGWWPPMSWSDEPKFCGE